jgi:hypothetical protein
MAASYGSDWPVLPGAEPRPIIIITRPIPLTAQLPAQSLAQSPAILPAPLPAPSPAPLPPPLPAPFSTEPLFTMSLPPEAQYESYDALHRAAQLFARNHGYTFTSRWSERINA